MPRVRTDLGRLLSLGVALGLAACAADTDAPGEATEEPEVKVDTRSPAARKQYDANVAFALGYKARCPFASASAATKRPRVLVTGFGRFGSIADNATGRIVSTLVPEARYPMTTPPAPGEVDLPEPQLSVGTRVAKLPGASGDVEICAMVLPVYWDLAAVLIAREIEAFRPDLVVMNGVAGSRQPLWLELGAVNAAAPLADGSDQLRAFVKKGETLAPLVEAAAPEDRARPNLLSWRAVEEGARRAVEANAARIENDVRFGDVAQGVVLAGFPRESNTYLCNNVTYTTGYLMDRPGKRVRLLRASTRAASKPNWVDVTLKSDHAAVPRVFVHWPSDLATVHREAGADVLAAILGAQLGAMARGEKPTRGVPSDADPTLQGGAFF
jgi:pyrrolidone-carboxylate peptidase